MNLQVELVEKEYVHCFKVIGEVDAFTAPLLKERLLGVQEIPGLQAEIDLSAAEYIDSTGLGVLVGFYKALQEHGGSMKVTGVSQRVNRLFKITGLDQIMDIEVREGGSRDAII